ncbi:adenylosuccinate synthetase [Ruminococcus sp.]|uniref:adenylosuccinate synthetase n=1 Tax=Ruminococcus sp. TaxID=41978 RepID=UPI0025E38766|nr:adenylosuccinate synthetase [Ruminococcus sp.]MBQ8965662.1 adenylosuccinate synthetase [Ruminococcus sp.]
MNTTAVIGACFGDEGKGLVTDALCDEDTAVVRHNGGAQAGHTVRFGEERFVFHQLGSGSFRGAATVWAESFLPDLFKLWDEYLAFKEVSGSAPKIYACPDTAVTLIDDVLVNMALETSRGAARHGSCGMGINEADLRTKAGFGVAMADLWGFGAERLFRRMAEIRREYLPKRLAALGLAASGEYGELLKEESVLRRAAEEMCRNADKTAPLADLSPYGSIVFEGAQGLLLDSENTRFAPHVTASRTGLDEPLKFCRRHGLVLDRAVYVTRSYLTRHGAGPLPHECSPDEIGSISPDRTNLPNPWQGSIRYAPHTSPEFFAEAVSRDLKGRRPPAAVLAVTHLNETAGSLRFISGDIPAADLPAHPVFAELFDGYYTSFADSGLAPLKGH